MSAATLDRPTPARADNQSTGPKTLHGKAVASRSALADPEGAVTHGLHATDVVLARELGPRTAVESHYVTQAAQAMWRLRRLARWEQRLYDDSALTDDGCIAKMARVLRHAALRRHIDRTLKALAGSPAKQNCQNCQNGPAPASTPAPPQSRRDFPSRKVSPALQSRVTNCQNEPAPAQPILPRRGR